MLFARHRVRSQTKIKNSIKIRQLGIGKLPFYLLYGVIPIRKGAFKMAIANVKADNCSPVAQLVEQAAVNRFVAGSSPAWGATSFEIYILIIYYTYITVFSFRFSR